jgi:hypothetical protein
MQGTCGEKKTLGVKYGMSIVTPLFISLATILTVWLYLILFSKKFEWLLNLLCIIFLFIEREVMAWAFQKGHLISTSRV